MSALGWATLAVIGGCVLFAVGMAIGASIAGPAQPKPRSPR